jgi:hypothetical protein
MIKEFYNKHAKGLNVQERIIDDDYVEVVIIVSEYPKWKEHLKFFLGGPLKDKGIVPSKEQTSMADPYGGIKAEQVLFASDIEGISIIAMLWPWQDEEHITLKLKEIS